MSHELVYYLKLDHFKYPFKNVFKSFFKKAKSYKKQKYFMNMIKKSNLTRIK